MALSADLYDTITRIVDDRINLFGKRIEEIRVEREDFDDLKREVSNLARNVNLLAHAQKRTEEKIEELAEAQKASENRLTRVERAVEELAEAQKASENRLTRVERALEELAQAQKRTEDAVKELAGNIRGLSETVGFGLEDIARVVIPGYLERHESIYLKGELGEELEQNFVKYGKDEIEIDLFGEGQREGKPIVVIGEVKSRIYEAEVKKFISRVVKLVRSTIKDKEIYPLMFGYLIHPSAKRAAEKEGIHLIVSYQR